MGHAWNQHGCHRVHSHRLLHDRLHVGKLAQVFLLERPLLPITRSSSSAAFSKMQGFFRISDIAHSVLTPVLSESHRLNQ
ncbi:hypothetical protein ACLOJK_041896 [Asimina triloba]